MPESLNLIITLRKEVPDTETGRAIFELIQNRLLDHPEVSITGHITNHLDLGSEEL